LPLIEAANATIESLLWPIRFGPRPRPIQDIDDIISFHGESITEFEAHFHAAIEDYLAASKELGTHPEKPASGKLMLRIAPEVHAAALKAAARSGTNLNKWAEGALRMAARSPGTRATARRDA
jgi:predicted HicB family RNase H-like nuclease